MKKGYKSLQRLDYRRDNRKFIYTRGINKDKDVENIKQCLDELDEYKRKEYKYRWHDLRKYPNDLPKNNSIVIFAHYCVGEKIGYSLVKFDENYIITKAELSWKYIEEFEDE